MAARLLSLGALVLVAAGCGAEAVPSDDRDVRHTARIETRRSSVDEETGCRWIVIGGGFYSEFPPGDGMPMGKRWVSSGGSALETDGEKLFEQSRARTSDDGSMTSSHVFFVTPDPTPEEYWPRSSHLRWLR